METVKKTTPDTGKKFSLTYLKKQQILLILTIVLSPSKSQKNPQLE
jgi:hypothetical protein